MTTTPSTRTAAPTALVRGGIVLVAVVVASLVNALIAALTVALGADSSLMALHASAFVPFTVIGMVLALVGWVLVRRLSAQPARVLRVLVPLVLLLSLVPDLLAAPQLPGASTLGVAGLMLMHVATAAVAVLGYSRAFPVR